MTPLPITLGLSICERVIVEEGTKNVTLVSTFTRLKVEDFPSPPQRFTLYAVLTDGLGHATIDVRVAHLDTGEEIYTLQRRVYFPDRLTEVRVVLRISEFSFPASGVYQFTLLIDGEWLAQRRLQLVERNGGS